MDKGMDPATPLKAYMAYDGQNGASEGACLVFARRADDAKVVAFPILSNWGCEWLDVRARIIKDADHLFAEANKEKLAQGIPHAIESPKTCRECDLWGEYIYLDGVCEDCRDAYDEAQLAERSDAPEASSLEGSQSSPPGSQEDGR